jgi:hypothetical protein
MGTEMGGRFASKCGPAATVSRGAPADSLFSERKRLGRQRESARRRLSLLPEEEVVGVEVWFRPLRATESLLSYLEALQDDRFSSCAFRGFGQVQTGAAGMACRQGQALHAAHDDADAQSAFKSAIDAKPASACGSQGLQAVDAKSFWDEVTTLTGRIGDLAGAIALAVVIVACAVGVVKALRNRMRQLAPQLQIKAFDDTGVDAKLGPGFAELLRSDLIVPASFGPQIDIVTGEAASPGALDALADALPDAAKPVSGVLGAVRALGARKQATLSGALHPSGELGFGVSVAIASTTSYNASDDLWTKDFPIDWGTDETSVLQRLAAPAAGYSRHAYTDHYFTGARAGPQRNEFHRVMGSDALAFALFRGAQDRAAVGDIENATTLCTAALDRAGDFALGLALRGELLGMTGEQDEAIATLTAALERL